MQTKQGVVSFHFISPKAARFMAHEGFFFKHRNQIHGIGLRQCFARHWTNPANIRLFSFPKLGTAGIRPAGTEPSPGISETPISQRLGDTKGHVTGPQFEGMCLVLQSPKA